MPSTSHHNITSDTKCSQQQIGKCPKPTTATSSQCSDSGISSDNISEEMSTTLESGNEEVNVITSEGETNTSQYITVGFLTTRIPVPPTSDVPVKYIAIGGHLTTVRIRILAWNVWIASHSSNVHSINL